MRPRANDGTELCEMGHIRTLQKCPKCRGTFKDTENELQCPACLTTPSRYFLDLHYQNKRVKLYKDESGRALDSYARAERLLNHIRWEVDNHTFNIEKYQKPKYEPFLVPNYTSSWLKEQEIRQRANEISFSTLYKSKMVVERYIVPYFGIKDIRTLGTREIKDFNLYLVDVVSKKGKPISAKYREFILGLLRQIYYDGMRSGDLTRAQVPMFPTVDVPDAPFDFLTEEEQLEILAKIPKHDYPIYHTILWYGIRPSEVRALKRDCILGDFDQILIRRTFTKNNRLRENPKENKWRVISLLDETKEILKKLPVSLTGFVFVNKWGRHYSQAYLNDRWNDACDDAGFRYIPLKNASRHSLGTKLAMQGYGENIIATVLGHSDTKVTKKYVRYASDSLKQFFERKKVKRGTVRKLSVGKKLDS